MSSPIFDSTFGTGRFMHEEPTKSPEPQDVREAFMQVLASLVAAVSLLKRGGNTAKKAAPSDKMFDQMILDYEKAIEQGRAALAQSDAGPPPLRYSDKVERAGDGTETRRLELAQSDAGPVAKPVTWMIFWEGKWELTSKDEYERRSNDLHWRDRVIALYPPGLTAPPRPDVSGLIEAAELAENIARVSSHKNKSRILNAFANVLRARAADRSGT